jgi:hypothetical protein
MIQIHHLAAGAAATNKLVHDDRDRLALVRRTSSAFGPRLLAYCLMDTHLHAVVEGTEDAARETLGLVLRGYARFFNARHGTSTGPLLRGPVHATRKTTPFELARTINYDHENPLRTSTPLAASAVAYEWSRARAFAGFTRAPLANIARARTVLGDEATRVRARRPMLADLEPVPYPTASLEALLGAVAQVHALLPNELASRLRAAWLNEPRGTFVALARLESYRDGQLARVLGRTPQRVGQLARHSDALGVRIARTIVRSPDLRTRLSAVRLSEIESGIAVTG